MTTTQDGIDGQFDYWRRAAMPAALKPDDATTVVIGCGTSYNLAISVASAMTARGLAAIAVPAGE